MEIENFNEMREEDKKYIFLQILDANGMLLITNTPDIRPDSGRI
jgi:hypothetical protein